MLLPPLVRTSTVSKCLASSAFAKYLAKAWAQNCLAVVGCVIGANAVTDLNIPGFLAAIIRAAPPPIENPVIALAFGLTGK